MIGAEAEVDVEQGIDAAGHFQRTAGRLVDAVEHLEQRGLAGAVGADEAKAVTGLELKAHPVECGHEAPVAAARDGAAGLLLDPLVARLQRQSLADFVDEAQVLGGDFHHQTISATLRR